jgi:hypothetical protein
MWNLEITNFLGGYAPGYWLSDYPSFGNKNQAGKMKDVSLINPTVLTQGPGLANLTNGDQDGQVSTLLRGLLDMAVVDDETYGVGGNKLYKVTSTAVTAVRTIDKGTVTDEDGEDVAYYQGKIYYTYNHSGTKGDIGQLTLPSTYDDDWGSTVPTTAVELQGGVPHPLLVAGNDFMYVGNKNYVTSYDGLNDVLTEKDLEIPTDCVIQDFAWASNRLWIAANRPDLSGNNKHVASIYVWDSNSPSWEEEIRVMGRIGALHVKNGIIFILYEDITSTGKLGYVSGLSITDIGSFDGDLPSYYQVTDYKDFILWSSGNNIFAWGGGDTKLETKLFQLANGGHATVGCVAAPFGNVIIASNATTNYRLAQFSGYAKGYWYSLLYDVTGDGRKSLIDRIKFNFEKLTTGARVDYTLKNNAGTTLKTGTISFTGDGAITSKDFYPKCETENLRVELSWAEGSIVNPVSIKNIKIWGNIIK